MREYITLKIVASFWIIMGTLVLSNAVAATPLQETASSSKPHTLSLGESVKPIVLADVNLTDVQVNEQDGKYVGRYTLTSGMGEARNISVGVILYDETHKIIDSKSVLMGASVAEGEKSVHQFSYVAPSFVKGKVTLALVAESAGGLPFSTQTFATKSYLGSGSSFSCTVVGTTTPNVTCVSKKAGILSFEVSPKSMFNPGLMIEKKNVKVFGKVVVVPVQNPGKYFVKVNLLDSDESVFLPLIINGPHATIMNTSISKGDAVGMVHVVVVTDTSSSAVSGVRVNLTSQNGKNCGTMGQVTIGGVSSMDLKASCLNGIAKVDVVNPSTGEILATDTGHFSVLSVLEQPRTKKHTEKFKGALTEKTQTVPLAIYSFIGFFTLMSLGLIMKKYWHVLTK